MSDYSSPDVLVTGRVGGALLQRMTATQIDALRARGVEAVHGTHDDPASVRAAMTGCRQLFLVSTSGADDLAAAHAVLTGHPHRPPPRRLLPIPTEPPGSGTY